MRSLLARTGFRNLVIGQGVSALGDWMGTVAFIVVVHELTDSSTAVAGILVLRLLPAGIAGPLTARLVQRWDRRRTMLAMDAARAAMIAVIPLVRAVWWVYLWAFLIELASLIFLPARDASIPDLAGDDDLPLANGLVLGSSYATMPIGAALFALVAALPFGGADGFGGRPFALVFWIDAGTYLISMVFIARLTRLGSALEPSDPETADGGFRAAFAIPLVRAVMPAAATVAMGLGALFSLGVVFVQETLNASNIEFGLLIALFGVGAVVGLGVLRVIDDHGLATVRAAVATQGAIIVVMSASPGVGFALLGACGFGAATAAALTSGMTILQERLAGADRVLAFAAFHIVIRVGLSLAAIMAGLAADLIDEVAWPAVGELDPTRLVLFCSGLVVIASSSLVTERTGRRAAEQP